MNTTRNRIKDHRRVKAADLLPHELNPRLHSDAQRAALQALYDQIGFARSVLAYEVVHHGQTRLKLIDGHLRQSMDPDMEVEVEVLDVNDEEARALLLSIDPLAQLAEYDAQALEQLRQLTATDSDALHNLWQSVGQANAQTADALKGLRNAKVRAESVPQQYLVIVECQDEQHQVNVLKQLRKAGLQCSPKMS